MTVAPDLDPDLLRELQEAYGLRGASFEFLPVGADLRSFSYRVRSDGAESYLKLRRSGGELSPDLAAYVAARVTHAITPLATRTGATWRAFGGFDAMLFPYVEGTSGWQAGLTSAGLRGLGRSVRSLHALPLPPDLATLLPREAYSPLFRRKAAAYLGKVAPDLATDSAAARFRDLLGQHVATLRTVVAQAESLATQLTIDETEWVVCHGDLHSGNLLVDASGTAHPVDWDTLSLAPREKDLMFVGAGIGGVLDAPDANEAFFEGYGGQANALAIRYFRLERVVQDVVAYAEQLLDTPEGDADRELMVEQFASQFRPGGVVEVALASPT